MQTPSQTPHNQLTKLKIALYQRFQGITPILLLNNRVPQFDCGSLINQGFKVA